LKSRAFQGVLTARLSQRESVLFFVLPELGEDGVIFERCGIASRFFAGGEAHVDVVESYVSGDFVVLVLLERQHGKVGGLPDQDWSLRVTMLFRREGDDWRLVHRHADPLVREIDLDRAAALARGSEPEHDG